MASTLPLDFSLTRRPPWSPESPNTTLANTPRHRLGQVAEEVIVAAAMGHVGELRRNPRHERVLLVGRPEGDRLVQRFRPLLGLGEQAPHLVRRGGDQGLGEPDPLPRPFPDDVEGLVALL